MTLLSCVVALYVVFSPIGLVGEGSNLFAPVLLGLLALNVLFWPRLAPPTDRRFGSSRMTKPSSPLEGNAASASPRSHREPYQSSGRKPRLLIVGAGMMGREHYACRNYSAGQTCRALSIRRGASSGLHGLALAH
ncbi:MAG: hypothetical protein CM15mP74_28770 [Halieaceae bacterium]|nr:MAG: hypothetical protein CM15mP74_28770 [Halieaceae bacterium]